MTYKKGDVVLVKSPAGDVIPNIHVKLLKRIIVKGQKGKFNGIGLMQYSNGSIYENEQQATHKFESLVSGIIDVKANLKGSGSYLSK